MVNILRSTCLLLLLSTFACSNGDEGSSNEAGGEGNLGDGGRAAAAGNTNEGGDQNEAGGTSKAGSTSTDEGVTVAESELKRELEPDVSSEDSATLTSDNLAFATELYARLAKSDGNLFLSPHSISTALAMTYAGASGATATQMANSLHYSLPSERLHPAFNRLDLELMSRATLSEYDPKGQPFELSIANALFGREGLTFEESFLDLLALNYGAGMKLLDFGDDETARGLINAWVSDKTNDKIPELIGPNILSEDTALVLTNAVYFNAGWQTAFSKDATTPAEFTRLDDSTVSVEMMHQSEYFAYGRGDGWAAVSIPYLGQELAMTIVLPDAGKYEALESGLTAEFVSDVLSSMASTNIELAIPKWSFDSEFELSTQLAELGMPLAFTPEADFSAMTNKTTLVISNVIHKAFVGVNEQGTEAAAATAVVMVDSALPLPPEITFEANRPFLFFIHDQPTGAVLFLGRLVDPAS